MTFNLHFFKLLLLTSLFIGVNTLAKAETSNAEKLSIIKQNIGDLEVWLDQANSEKKGLVEDLKSQSQEIGKINRRIERANKALKKINREIDVLKSSNRQQTAALEKRKKGLLKQVRAAYQQSQQPPLKLLLDSQDLTQTVRVMKYFDYLNIATVDQIKGFEIDLAALESTRSRIESQQAVLAKNQQNLEEHRKDLRVSEERRRVALAKLDSSITSKSNNLKQLQADQERLANLIDQVGQAYTVLPDLDQKAFSKLKSQLNRPVDGRVKHRYRSRLGHGNLRSNGITYEAKLNSPVQAVHGGTIVFSDWIRGFGLMLIVDHGEGFMSLYGHNNSLVKEVGEIVQAGEIISYAGEYDPSGKSGLYFEIRKDGKPINPHKWLRG